MRRSLILFLAALSSVMAVACASSGGGRGGQDTYSVNLGRLVDTFLEESRQKIWTKHGIPLYRQQTSVREIYYESEWIVRAPEPGEAALGVSEARNRILLRGLRAGEDGWDPDMGGLFRTTMELQNQVRTAEVPDWHPAPIPDGVMEDFRRFFSDMEMEVRAGVRR